MDPTANPDRALTVQKEDTKMTDDHQQDVLIDAIRVVEDRIMRLLNELEKDHNIEIREVDVSCEGNVKFRTAIHI